MANAIGAEQMAYEANQWRYKLSSPMRTAACIDLHFGRQRMGMIQTRMTQFAYWVIHGNRSWNQSVTNVEVPSKGIEIKEV